MEIQLMKRKITGSFLRLCTGAAFLLLGGGGAGLVSCTDTWNDHYEAPVDNAVEGSLWEVISNNTELSNFASVLQATGYDRALASSQVFTVFAPTNNALSTADVKALIATYNEDKADNVKENDNRTIKEFVQNHIALYNHSVSDLSDGLVTMMNGKYLPLTKDALGNSSLLTWNELTANGVLFTIGTKADYGYNLYEYLIQNNEVDSVGRFLRTFSEYEFVPSSSVPGGIIDGRTWYLDSVFVLTNKLFEKPSVRYSWTMEPMGNLNSEDSTYWMVAPTNPVWDELVARYTPYFNYDNRVEKRDSLQWVKTRLAILEGTVFSQTRNLDFEGSWNRDSVLSVNAVEYSHRESVWGNSNMKYYQFESPFVTGGIFNGTTEVDCSNGKILKTTAWSIDPRETFMRTILVQGESRSYLDGIDEKTTNEVIRYTVPTYYEYYSNVLGHSFALVSPKGQTAAEVRYKLPNVLSNVPYDLYAVFVPCQAQDTLLTDTVPCKFNASISYHRQDGLQSADYYLPENDSTLTSSRRFNFVTDPHKVDTVQLASGIMFPTCSYDEDNQVMVRLRTSLRAADRRDHTYTDNMRIDCLILRPHEDN